jgi:hypothetical protein
MPPPARESGRAAARSRRAEDGRVSGIKNMKPDMPAATVDEVTADMSKDPRHERDDEIPHGGGDREDGETSR